MDKALRVEVEHAVANLRLVEGHVARIGRKGIGNRIALLVGAAARSKPGPLGAGKSVQIKTEGHRRIASVVDDSLQLALKPVVARRRHVLIAAAREAALGNSAECVEDTVVVPRVGVACRVIVLAENLIGSRVGFARQVREIGDHSAPHHFLEQELAEWGHSMALAEAGLPGWWDAQVRKHWAERAEDVLEEEREIERRLGKEIIAWAIGSRKDERRAAIEAASLHVGVVAILRKGGVVARLDDVAELDDSLLTVARGKGVVVLVHREEHAHTAVVIVVEACSHVLFRAAREPDRRAEEAVEQIGDLDSQHDSQLAVQDHLSSLGW